LQSVVRLQLVCKSVRKSSYLRGHGHDTGSPGVQSASPVLGASGLEVGLLDVGTSPAAEACLWFIFPKTQAIYSRVESGYAHWVNWSFITSSPTQLDACIAEAKLKPPHLIRNWRDRRYRNA
jgi:hypothetical protein